MLLKPATEVWEAKRVKNAFATVCKGLCCRDHEVVDVWFLICGKGFLDGALHIVKIGTAI